ncbi:MAG: hypothetical protein LBE83_01370 [Propionibacteriaceae bacterium]|nr:hypothetical protein [Propionibacteriaceae bacterium]
MNKKRYGAALLGLALAASLALTGCGSTGPADPVEPGGKPLTAYGITHCNAANIFLPDGLTVTKQANDPEAIYLSGPVVDGVDYIGFMKQTLGKHGWTIIYSDDTQVSFENAEYEGYAGVSSGNWKLSVSQLDDSDDATDPGNDDSTDGDTPNSNDIELGPKRGADFKPTLPTTGKSLTDLGVTHPIGALLWLPDGVTITQKVTADNVLTVVASVADGVNVATYLDQTLGGLGWRVVISQAYPEFAQYVFEDGEYVGVIQITGPSLQLIIAPPEDYS